LRQEDNRVSSNGAYARSYLGRVTYSRTEVNRWLAGENTGYAYRTVHEMHDGELGWVPHAGRMKHGVNGSMCSYNYESSGARRMTIFDDGPCRVNTYGDSFTHGDQVSDGETWQERLAAHLCEPIRNFGVSGHSVYQAYTRMKREEVRTPAEYVIFNIFSDDHYRNLSEWYWSLSLVDERRPPAPHVRANPASGEFIEFPNPCPTPESLFNLCDLDWIYEHFKDDFHLKIVLAKENIKHGTPEKSYEKISALAREHGIEWEINEPEILAATLDEVYTKAALFSSMRIVKDVEKFASSNGKKVLYLLSYKRAEVARVLEGHMRFDQTFVDFLNNKELDYVDALQAHVQDFAQFKSNIDDYLWRYYVPPPFAGHYSPSGNLFLALAMREKLVPMLDPKPIANSG
jgi:hypothetical protein